MARVIFHSVDGHRGHTLLPSLVSPRYQRDPRDIEGEVFRKQKEHIRIHEYSFILYTFVYIYVDVELGQRSPLRIVARSRGSLERSNNSFKVTVSIAKLTLEALQPFLVTTFLVLFGFSLAALARRYARLGHVHFDRIQERWRSDLSLTVGVVRGRRRIEGE